MTSVKLTTVLSDIIGSKTINYNPALGTIASPLSKEQFYKWEARLCQSAFLSRLVYCPSDVFLKGIRFLDYSPDVCNDIVTLLEHTSYKTASFDSLFVSQGPDVPTQGQKRGRFFPRTGCAIFQHQDPSSKINNEKVCYIVFKGSSSMRDFMNDAKLQKMDLKTVPQLAGLPGTTHAGFYIHMKDELDQIFQQALELSQGCESVYITGHSLGGAMSTLFSLMLAKAKSEGKLNQKLHCITHGAPNLFSDEARNAYNKYLLDGTMTLDRVTTNKDIIPPIPGVYFSHPGFTLINTELFPTKKTGRAINIDDVRAVFLGKNNVVQQKGLMGSLGHNNELPADPIFWNLFKQIPGDVPLEQRLKNYGRVNRQTNMGFAQFVLGQVKPEDLPIILTAADEAAINKMDEQESKAEEAQLSALVSAADAANKEQNGGAFFESDAKKAYKQEAFQQYPNRIKYQCYTSIAAGFCHAVYMGIGFVGGVRVPKLVLRDPITKKIAVKPVRRLEPTQQTDFIASSDAYSPIIRYYAVLTKPVGGQRKRKNRITRKRDSRRNNTRKHSRGKK